MRPCARQCCAKAPGGPAFARAAAFVAENALRVPAPDRQRRRHPKCDAGDERERARHEHGHGIQREIRVGGQHRQRQLAEAVKPDRCEREPRGAAGNREDHALGQQLSDEATAPGT